MCGGIYTRIFVTLFIPKIGSKIDCVVYTGLYYFMKEIPVTLIYNVLYLIRVGVPVTLLCS